MKIALTCPASFPATQFGGILFLCVDIAREISKRSHNVTIYTTDLDFADNTNSFNRKLPRVESQDGFVIKRSHVYLKVKLFFVNPGLYLQLKNDLPDIIHVVGIRSFQALVGALISKLHSIPLVVTDQGGLFTHPDFNSSKLNSFLYRVQGPFIKLIIKQAKKIIVANEYEQMIFSKYCDESKLQIIKNGINFEQIRVSPFDFKQKYKISERMILFLGRFNKVKGIDLLLDAFSSICALEEFDDVTLVILGADFGYEKEMIKKINKLRIQNRIKIFQKPPRQDVIAAYHACEFAVLPSRWEMSPLTPLELFTCKKPVISTNVYGIPYVVINEKNGLLVSPENPNEIKGAIIKLLNDKNLRNQFGLEGFMMVQNELNSKTMAENVLKIYFSVLKDK